MIYQNEKNVKVVVMTFFYVYESTAKLVVIVVVIRTLNKDNKQSKWRDIQLKVVQDKYFHGPYGRVCTYWYLFSAGTFSISNYLDHFV